jgi:predicted HTH transcriptional regulator
MELPAWVHGPLSSELPLLRERGEGQELEFKREFPPQAHDLAQEVAAFATSGTGRILLGVADNGELVGLAADDGSAREKLRQRAQGIVRTIRPNVKAECLFALEAEKTILCILIPQQDEPVFYYEGRPYIRDGSSSRPATPEEVKDHVWKHPSSAYKLRMEEVRLQQTQAFIEQNRLAAQRCDEQSRLANQRSDDLTKEISRRLIGR